MQKQLIELEEITRKIMHEQRNDEEEADFLTELIDEKPATTSMDVMKTEEKNFLDKYHTEIKKNIPPDLEKPVEIFKKLLKSEDVCFYLAINN